MNEPQGTSPDESPDPGRWLDQHREFFERPEPGNGQLSNGVYCGLAHESELVLVKVSERGRITEENIAQGIKWVIANRERYNIRVLNISLGGDEDVACSRSIVDQAAEEAISQGITVIAAAGMTPPDASETSP